MTAKSPVQGYNTGNNTTERENITAAIPNNTNNGETTNLQISLSPQLGNRQDGGDIGKPASRQRNTGERVVQQNNGQQTGEGFGTYRTVADRKPTPYYDTQLDEEVARFSVKARDIDNQVDQIERNSRNLPQAVGKVEARMAYDSRAVEDLQMRSKVYSAKIHELERELKNVKLESQVIRGHYNDDGHGHGHPGNNGYHHDQNGRMHEHAQSRHPEEAGDPRWRQAHYAHPQNAAPPGQFNPRPNIERDKDGRRMYENDQFKHAHAGQQVDGQIYWGFNKFYDPQFLTAYRREHVPYYARKEENDQNQRTPGGLMFIRFHDQGYNNVNLSLRELQTLIKSYGGYVLGIARKGNIVVMEGEQGWYPNPKHEQHPQMRVQHRMTDNAVATFWFPNREKAFLFLGTSYKNRFMDKNNFPTQHSYEAHFIPLLAAPYLRSQDTILMLELMDASKLRDQDLMQFEADLARALQDFLPNSLPVFAAVSQGKESFKLGGMFSARSKAILSCVGSIQEVSEIWERGIIQNLLHKYDIRCPINVSAIALRDWSDS